MLRHARRVGCRDRLCASILPYSATDALIPIEPATQIHSIRPRDGSPAISSPGMHHRSVDSPRSLGYDFGDRSGLQNFGRGGRVKKTRFGDPRAGVSKKDYG